MLLSIVDKIKITGVTLLSETEANTLLTKEERAYKNSWWLYTHGDDSKYAYSIDYDGYINCFGRNVNYSGISVRPTLKINIIDPCVLKGDTFRFGGHEFKIISSELAWMHKDDIGSRPFRYDYEADDANDYEASDVKNYIEEWFNKTIVETTGSDINEC